MNFKIKTSWKWHKILNICSINLLVALEIPIHQYQKRVILIEVFLDFYAVFHPVGMLVEMLFDIVQIRRDRVLFCAQGQLETIALLLLKNMP